MNRMFIALALSLGFTATAFAGVKVTSLNLRTDGPNGFISVAVNGRSNELPDIKVYKNVIEMTLSQAEAFNAISKNISGAVLTANILNGKAIVKATLPYDVQADTVNLNWKNNSIEVSFPRNRNNKAATLKAVVVPVVASQVAFAITPTNVPVQEIKKPQPEIKKDHLNEDYLNKLMNEESTPKAVAAPKIPSAPPLEIKKDEIKVQQAAIAKSSAAIHTGKGIPSKSTDNFSFAGYALKFTVFLALVLGLFYGVVQLLKKGVFSRGKLGFLNNGQMIQVLSTTYVSPKRSLMIVKAHKQIFLVANSESGLEFLSEMKDTSGLIKEGEKLVTGSNFDLNFATADSKTDIEDTKIKLKENILESTPVNEERGISKLAVAKDIVKFSDELKKKARKLKPIEFN